MAAVKLKDVTQYSFAKGFELSFHLVKPLSANYVIRYCSLILVYCCCLYAYVHAYVGWCGFVRACVHACTCMCVCASTSVCVLLSWQEQQDYQVHLLVDILDDKRVIKAGVYRVSISTYEPPSTWCMP